MKKNFSKESRVGERAATLELEEIIVDFFLVII